MAVTILVRSLLILATTEALRSHQVGGGVQGYGGWLGRSPSLIQSTNVVILPLVSYLIHFFTNKLYAYNWLLFPGIACTAIDKKTVLLCYYERFAKDVPIERFLREKLPAKRL